MGAIVFGTHQEQNGETSETTQPRKTQKQKVNLESGSTRNESNGYSALLVDTPTTALGIRTDSSIRFELLDDSIGIGLSDDSKRTLLFDDSSELNSSTIRRGLMLFAFPKYRNRRDQHGTPYAEEESTVAFVMENKNLKATPIIQATEQGPMYNNHFYMRITFQIIQKDNRLICNSLRIKESNKAEASQHGAPTETIKEGNPSPAQKKRTNTTEEHANISHDSTENKEPQEWVNHNLKTEEIPTQPSHKCHNCQICAYHPRRCHQDSNHPDQHPHKADTTEPTNGNPEDKAQSHP
ncbi:hypothetical protein WN48_01892 [Eufriesea mexicana]|nr:hypothetical protein WN48_01892 [Eufriesea mexicana]